MAILQSIMSHSAEGDFILFDQIPVLTIEIRKGPFQMLHDIYLPEKRIGKSSRP